MRTRIRLRSAVAALAALGLVLVPVAGASHQFTDVPNDHPFHTEISIFKDSNITSGCTATTFCPTDFVRRQAMAAFIDRALGLVVRPGESTQKGIPGSRVAMLDDGTSLVGTNASGLELSYNGARLLRIDDFGNVVGGYLATIPTNGNGVSAGVTFATIGGGGSHSFGNRISGNWGTIAGGRANQAGGAGGLEYGAVGGGFGNVASGTYGTVPGGYSNTADGTRSFAAGTQAKANHQGSFVWADSQFTDFASTANDQFSVRASGGVRLLGNTGIGRGPHAVAGRPGSLAVQGPLYTGGDNATACHIYVGDDVCLKDEQNGALNVRQFSDANYTSVRASTFTTASTRALKKDVRRLGMRDADAMLAMLERLPLFRYRYRSEPASQVTHTGVIAERSPAQILSADGKALSVSDFAGVTAGATKALSRRVKGLEAENRTLKTRLAALERQIAALAAQR